MELHSIIFLATILAIIFLLTYFITTRQKRSFRHLTTKQEPRFDLHPYPLTTDKEEIEELNYFDNSHQNQDERSYQENLLLDTPTLKQNPISPQGGINNSHPPKSETKAKKTNITEEIIYFILVSQPDKPYIGYELLQTLLSLGLRYGAMNIFHRHEDITGKGKILFSIASASEPGSFEINKMGAFSGKGLMVFLRLSINKDVMHAFDLMLETSKQLIEDLGGEILDEERKPLSENKVEKFRKKIQNFEQKQLIGDLFD